MAVFTMIIGIGSSGKTTYAEKLAEKTGAVLLSWSNTPQGYNKWLQGIINLIKEGNDVIVEGIAIKACVRSSLLRQLPECTKQCVVMATPFDTCADRDECSPRGIGLEPLAMQRKMFQPPYYNEGWDTIKFQFADVLLSNEEHHKKEREFDQENKYHRFTVGNHEARASDYAVTHNFAKSVDLAAKFHDCGKLYCQVFDKEDEAHYPNHASVSAYQMMTMFSFSKFIQFYEDEALETLALVAWHMFPYQFKRCESPRDELNKWCESKGFSKEFAEHLWQLHQADVWAH